jgi:hypothetical protein
MKLILTTLMLSIALISTAQKVDTRYFELRVYYCKPGRLDALIQRFQNHTTKIFEKHGMENIGYWVPVTNDQNALYYILAFPSKEAREKSWKDFGADPKWKEVQTKSEESGPIIDSIASIPMTASEIMPKLKPGNGNGRLFELRTYTCLPGRLPNLTTRFKDHTVKLFEKQEWKTSCISTLTKRMDHSPSWCTCLLTKTRMKRKSHGTHSAQIRCG